MGMREWQVQRQEVKGSTKQSVGLRLGDTEGAGAIMFKGVSRGLNTQGTHRTLQSFW